MQRMTKTASEFFFPTIANPEITNRFRVGRNRNRKGSLIEQKQFVPGDLVEVKTVPKFSILEKEIPSCFVRLFTKDFKSIRMTFGHSKIPLSPGF